jgi:hypothetical protein
MKKRLFLLIYCFIQAALAQGQAFQLSKQQIQFINKNLDDNRNISLNIHLKEAECAEITEALRKDVYTNELTEANEENYDSLEFSKQEKESIDEWLQMLCTQYWTKDNIRGLELPIIQLIEPDSCSLTCIYDQDVVYSITPPLLLRSDKLCIFYYQYICSPKCKHVQLAIYKKKGRKWILKWLLYFGDA